MRVGAVVALLLVLAACNGDDGSFGDVEGVVDALADEGVECENLDTTDEFASETDADVSERGLCVVDGKPVVISLFDDAAARREWVDAAGGLGSGPVAAGENWVISADSPDLIQRAAAALDGTIAGPND
ncbi:MAG TPA: hypothetical protein VJ927_07115 [Actinomycetota bacterium]|nr:hypothetical protein [Actinomycetota bacterium]